MWSNLWSLWLCHEATPKLSPGGGKSLLLIPVILLRYLKAEFEKKKRKQLLLIQVL
jgi:hypothetical protein